jgi:aminopeptidase N
MSPSMVWEFSPPKETPLVAGRFATYYALLAKEIYGEDHFYSKLYESAQLKFSNGYHSTECQSQFIDFLSKGAWALLFYTKK